MTFLLSVVLASCPLTDGTILTPQQAELVCALDARKTATAAIDRQALTAIYARPEFTTSRDGAAADLLRRMKVWLESLFETSGAETFSNITRFAVLALAALAIVFVVVRFSRKPPRSMKTASARDDGPFTLADPAEHLKRATALLRDDPRQSTREALLALLAALERRRLARPDRVKTNRELARELPERGAPPDVTEAVTAQLSSFDRAWYSLEPLDGAAASAFLESTTAIISRVNAWGTAR